MPRKALSKRRRITPEDQGVREVPLWQTSDGDGGGVSLVYDSVKSVLWYVALAQKLHV